MASSGYLVPPSKDPSQEKLWVETWKRIDRFLPDLRKELSLEGEEEPTVAPEEPVIESQAAAEKQEPVQPRLDKEQTEMPADEE